MKMHSKEKSRQQFKNTFECTLHTSYSGYQPKASPIPHQIKSIYKLSEKGIQSLPEFFVGPNYSNLYVLAWNLSFKSAQNITLKSSYKTNKIRLMNS